MADAIEILIDEHRMIERMLGAFESFAERIGEEPEGDRTQLRQFADFFHRFVDTIHHGKEETYLFVHMKAYGFSAQDGPVSAMLSEQGEGREHLDALEAVARGSGPLSAHERSLVNGHVLGYLMRIASHMKREDEILFPVARHALPSFVLQELTGEFEKFDSGNDIRALREELLRNAEQLLTKYPPGTDKTASAARDKVRADMV